MSTPDKATEIKAFLAAILAFCTALWGWLGWAVLILWFGDLFHLVPRIARNFAEEDFQRWIDAGTMVTSITMTVFYVLLYEIWKGYYQVKGNRKLQTALWALLALRVGLCLFPQNGWLQNSSDMTWGILRNVPFVALGGIICGLYYQKRGEAGPGGDRSFRFLWLLILLSFLFYLPVAVAAGILPILGMLMLPKTVCYILMIIAFWKASK